MLPSPSGSLPNFVRHPRWCSQARVLWCCGLAGVRDVALVRDDDVDTKIHGNQKQIDVRWGLFCALCCVCGIGLTVRDYGRRTPRASMVVASYCFEGTRLALRCGTRADWVVTYLSHETSLFPDENCLVPLIIASYAWPSGSP